jgi:hypothetical protein
MPDLPMLSILIFLATLPCAPGSAAGSEKKPNPNLERLHAAVQRTLDSEAIFHGTQYLPSLQKKVSGLTPDADPRRVFTTKLALGDAYLRDGQVDEAIGVFEQCVELVKLAAPEVRAVALRWLAVANMRRGELANCVAHRGADTCIFPLSASAVYGEQAWSNRAVECLTQALKLKPDDLTCVWLLNLVHMTLGTYPRSVPEQFQIPPTAFASEYDIPRFPDIAPKLGLNRFGTLGGAIMDDFNNDGFLDLMTSCFDLHEGIKLFLNKGDGHFEDVSDRNGLSEQVGVFQIVQADYDNDGRLDVLALRGGWMRQWGDLPDSLLRQRSDGTFEDVTDAAGLVVSGPGQVGVFADYDNDGWLDVFIGRESQGSLNFPSRLYHSKRDGTFEDVTERAGVVNNDMCKGAAFADFDGDRLPDLYVSNFHSKNRLYKNNGDGTFTDVAEKLGVIGPIDSFPCWFFDYDNDGDLDLLVMYYGMSFRSAQMADYYKNGKVGTDTTRLYENDGHGGFRDVTAERGMRRVNFAMGSNFGDLDGDGYPDVYLGTGDPDYSSLWPNIMLRNDRGKRFQDVTTAGGFGLLQKGHGVAFGDLDNDGDQDIFMEMGGAYANDRFWSVLFENPGFHNHWLTVKLIGKTSNRSAIGARIRVRIKEGAGERDVYAFVSGGGSFGGNSLQQEIGLGQAERILALEVFWPTTGKTQSFAEVPLDRFLDIEEGATEFKVCDRKTIRF